MSGDQRESGIWRHWTRSDRRSNGFPNGLSGATRLADQLGKLEIAERVLRGKSWENRKSPKGRFATTAPAASGERSAPGTRRMATVALRDAVLKAVAARPQVTTANEVLTYMSQHTA